MAGIVDIFGRVALAMKNASGVMGEISAANPLPTSERGGLAASASFTPAASAHTAPACNGAAQEFALNAPSGCLFEIDSVSMLVAGGTIETTAWTLHLYSVTPPSALADTTTFDIPSGDRASYLGFITIPQVVDYGASLWIESLNLNKQVKLTGTSVFGYLVNGTTLTPQAVAHTVTLIGRPI